MRKTKIVATLGPATSSQTMIEKLAEAGVDVFRLNFSHGDHATFRGYVEAIREVEKGQNRPLAILQDLQGPKIRTGKLVEGVPVLLEEGENLVITTEKIEGNAQRVSTTYPDLPRDLSVGDAVLISDGALELEVTRIQGNEVECRIVHGGILKERQGINLPGVPLSTPAFTQKDVEDLRLGLELGVDYVGLSFVRHASDIERLRAQMESFGRVVPIIAKIEKPQAVNNLEEIVKASDGVMVARGDLGVEIRTERVPVIQKRIITMANRHGKPVITATQMLESMIVQIQPTRAEASDVANAIFDGTDAVMLSGETSIGNYPLEAVKVMNRIAIDVERNLSDPDGIGQRILRSDFFVVADATQRAMMALAEAACRTAETLEVAGIAAFTITGETAMAVSKRHPACPIHAITPNEETWRRSALWRGVQAWRMPDFDDTDEMIEAGEAVLFANQAAKIGDTMICIAGASTHTPGGTNLLQIHAFDGHNPYEGAKETS